MYQQESTLRSKRCDGSSRRSASVSAAQLALALLALFLASSVAWAQSGNGVIEVPVRSTLRKLLAKEDTDGDRKITANDRQVPLSPRGGKNFSFVSLDHQRHEINGTYHLSNLLQELRLLEEAGRDTAALRFDRIFEPPVERISRCIREYYWDGLTRRIDKGGLPAILRDDKTSTIDGKRYLYVPAKDSIAFSYFGSLAHRQAKWNLEVVRLPDRPSREYVRSRDRRHGILSLAHTPGTTDSAQGVPFVVPGGRFNEMYGWDSYFILLGLLHDGRVDLAKSIVDNFVYEIEYYGKVLNANRTYYLTRSQPPFLTSMALEVCKYLPLDSLNHVWLRRIVESAIHEYTAVWTNPEHLTSTGLSRYFDEGRGVPPEVEPGHFDVVFSRFAARRGMVRTSYERDYKRGVIHEPDLDEFFIHDRAMRESGHDTCYRLYGRCADLVTVDLNSLLYKIERDIAAVLERQFGGSAAFGDRTTQRSTDWFARAEKRKSLVTRYLWDPTRAMFFDYDYRKGQRVVYVSATTFYPLWAELATGDQAEVLVHRALPLLEMPGGLVASTEESRGAITPDHPLRQWDYPFGWAPHQMLLWQGLKNFGYNADAARLAYRWLYMITLNASNFNGTVTEKYDVVRRSHDVFAEYGNVGTKFAYITKEGFGWTNASYQVGLDFLDQKLRNQLDALIPPEDIFDTKK